MNEQYICTMALSSSKVEISSFKVEISRFKVEISSFLIFCCGPSEPS